MPRLPPVDAASAATVPASTLTAELLAGLLADSDHELAGWALQHASDRLGVIGEAVTAIKAARADLPVMLRGRLAGHPGLNEPFELDWTGTSVTAAARFAASVGVARSRPIAVEGRPDQRASPTTD